MALPKCRWLSARTEGRAAGAAGAPPCAVEGEGRPAAASAPLCTPPEVRKARENAHAGTCGFFFLLL